MLACADTVLPGNKDSKSLLVPMLFPTRKIVSLKYNIIRVIHNNINT